MKVYKGKLSKEIIELVAANIKQLKRLIGRTGGLGKASNQNTIYSIDETIAKYNPGITEDEIKAWVWYRKIKGIPMLAWAKYDIKVTETILFNWVKNKVVFYDTTIDELVPYPVFLFGNIYSKISSLVKKSDEIIKLYGQSTYDNHLEVLTKAKPKQLSIQNPIASERPIILAISTIADEFTVTTLRDETGVILTQPESLKSAFMDWLKNQPDTYFNKTRAFEIVQYYLNGVAKPRSIDKIEWNAIKKNTRDEGERTFKIFLHTALEHQDQVRIDADYNTKYNATAALQYHKIPIGLEVSKKFMGFDLDIRPAQREGIAFMELVGSGIIAYDVGVGKTITAIIETASAINNGKCKRPMIVVPNPTYKNWIKEMFGVDGLAGILTGTDITLNEWYNLGADYDHINLNKKVPEKSITLLTYEGAAKIGFNEFTQENHFDQLAKIIAQDEDGTDRDNEKNNEKLREIIGVGNKETIADIETLGIDYVVVDEAHNFKNIFTEVKSGKNDVKRFHIQGGSPSNRGIKMFFICNYIQRTYGRNIMLLTATPFNNSPLEIYSMLSMVAYDYMRTWSILNIKHFFEQFIQETTEHVVGVDGEIKEKNVVKSFNNRIALQKLINSHINFKTGEEANIPRPCKINLPKTTQTIANGSVEKLEKDNQILTYLELNDDQKQIQADINRDAAGGASKDDPGKLLRLMGESLNNALSPFITKQFRKPKDYVDFVENSPKILYTMECIRSVKQYHENRNEDVSGQVIYMDRGKQYFHYVKEYLETELGYKKNQKLTSNPKLKVDEVEIISSGISGAKKEKIKDAFNEGVCKIIIGTSTIKEGINLQKRASGLYNLYPNWNPTDIRQLEGRIWRQKNMYGYVRIVMPLMENSMDVFVFQKLDEKTSRINDLWNTSERGNVLDEDSLDPNEVKFALVTDLNVLLRFELKQISAELSNKNQILTKQIEQLDEYNTIVDRLTFLREKIYTKCIDANNRINTKFVTRSGDLNIYFSDISSIKDIEKLTKDAQNQIERFKKVKDLLHAISVNDYTDKSMIVALSAYKRLEDGYRYGDYDLDRFKTTVSEYAKATVSIFDQRGYKRNTNLQEIKLEMEQELKSTADELEDLKTEDFSRKLYNRIKAEKEKYAIKGGSLDSRVKDFESLNHLLSYKFKDVDHTSCLIPTKEYDVKPNTDKLKRIRIAKAKAQAIKIKLLLAA
tara:strand:- start:2351 stop:5947 length:3597 start_codon:yes stop_codon:yes gene_type:complete